MSAPTITSQAATRLFVYGEHVALRQAAEIAPQAVSAPSECCRRLGSPCPGCPDPYRDQFDPAMVRGHLSPRIRDLHARADLMFRCGYQASGWALRNAAFKLEGGK